MKREASPTILDWQLAAPHYYYSGFLNGIDRIRSSNQSERLDALTPPGLIGDREAWDKEARDS